MPRYIKADAAAPPPKTVRYSHAVEAGGLLYVTGQLPIDPENPDFAYMQSLVASTRVQPTPEPTT